MRLPGLSPKLLAVASADGGVVGASSETVDDLRDGSYGKQALKRRFNDLDGGRKGYVTQQEISAAGPYRITRVPLSHLLNLSRHHRRRRRRRRRRRCVSLYPPKLPYPQANALQVKQLKTNI